MAGIASGLGGLAGRGVGIAAQGAAGVAGATTGFVGGMISPVIQFFNDVIKQRIAAADEAGRKREARDDKIVEICEVNWKEDVVIKTLVVKKEVPPAPPREEVEGSNPKALDNTARPAEGAPLQIQNSPRPAEGAPLQIQNSPRISEELVLRNKDK